MFEHLAVHSRILVTGPQRSGTTIAARMIAADTGHRFIDESEFGVYDVPRWRALLAQDEVVIQCPHMIKLIVDERRDDIMVVLMRRDLREVHASENRIGWEQTYRGNSAELAVFGLSKGRSADVKYAYWDAQPKPPHFIEIAYESLHEHPLHVSAEQRTSFGRKDTAPQSAPSSTDQEITDAWMSWLVSAAMLGVEHAKIRQVLQAQGGVSPIHTDRVLATLDSHPYYCAGARLGYRVRKLEALLAATRESARVAATGLKIDRYTSLGETEFLQRYFGPNRPVVLTDLTHAWGARNWLPHSLGSRYSQNLVESRCLADHDDPHLLARSLVTSAFLEAITGLNVTGDRYLAHNDAALTHEAVRPLLADLHPLPPFLAPDPAGTHTSLRLHVQGAPEGLGFLSHSVLLVQVLGSTLIQLASPDQAPLLYNTSYAVSEVDPESPDLQRHPAFAHARLATVTLESGDALFIPVGWFHHLRPEEAGIGVRFSGFTVSNEHPQLREVSESTSP